MYTCMYLLIELMYTVECIGKVVILARQRLLSVERHGISWCSLVLHEKCSDDDEALY